MTILIVSFSLDVIAFVKCIGRLEPYWKDDVEKNKLRLVITDHKSVYCTDTLLVLCIQANVSLCLTFFSLHMHRDSDVECVLWDECSSEAYSDYIMNEATPVVVIFNLARIGFSLDGMFINGSEWSRSIYITGRKYELWGRVLYFSGVAQVHNSFNATKILFNPDIKEVSEYISKNWYWLFHLKSVWFTSCFSKCALRNGHLHGFMYY